VGCDQWLDLDVPISDLHVSLAQLMRFSSSTFFAIAQLCICTRAQLKAGIALSYCLSKVIIFIDKKCDEMLVC